MTACALCQQKSEDVIMVVKTNDPPPRFFCSVGCLVSWGEKVMADQPPERERNGIRS